MHVMALISLKIVMRQFVSNFNLILIIIPCLNAPGDTPSTDPLTITHLTTIQLEIHMKLIAMQILTYNFQFQPTNQTKWLNCWKPPNR